MAVTIRLRRAGNRNNPFYHIVATNSRWPRDGRFLEQLGHYNPRTEPHQFVIDRERYDHWVKQGATASSTVSRLVAKTGKPAETTES